MNPLRTASMVRAPTQYHGLSALVEEDPSFQELSKQTNPSLSAQRVNSPQKKLSIGELFFSLVERKSKGEEVSEKLATCLHQIYGIEKIEELAEPEVFGRIWDLAVASLMQGKDTDFQENLRLIKALAKLHRGLKLLSEAEEMRMETIAKIQTQTEFEGFLLFEIYRTLSKDQKKTAIAQLGKDCSHGNLATFYQLAYLIESKEIFPPEALFSCIDQFFQIWQRLESGGPLRKESFFLLKKLIFLCSPLVQGSDYGKILQEMQEIFSQKVGKNLIDAVQRSSYGPCITTKYLCYLKMTDEQKILEIQKNWGLFSAANICYMVSILRHALAFQRSDLIQIASSDLSPIHRVPEILESRPEMAPKLQKILPDLLFLLEERETNQARAGYLAELGQFVSERSAENLGIDLKNFFLVKDLSPLEANLWIALKNDPKNTNKVVKAFKQAFFCSSSVKKEEDLLKVGPFLSIVKSLYQSMHATQVFTGGKMDLLKNILNFLETKIDLRSSSWVFGNVSKNWIHQLKSWTQNPEQDPLKDSSLFQLWRKECNPSSIVNGWIQSIVKNELELYAVLESLPSAFPQSLDFDQRCCQIWKSFEEWNPMEIYAMSQWGQMQREKEFFVDPQFLEIEKCNLKTAFLEMLCATSFFERHEELKNEKTFDLFLSAIQEELRRGCLPEILLSQFFKLYQINFKLLLKRDFFLQRLQEVVRSKWDIQIEQFIQIVRTLQLLRRYQSMQPKGGEAVDEVILQSAIERLAGSFSEPLRGQGRELLYLDCLLGKIDRKSAIQCLLHRQEYKALFYLICQESELTGVAFSQVEKMFASVLTEMEMSPYDPLFLDLLKKASCHFPDSPYALELHRIASSASEHDFLLNLYTSPFFEAFFPHYTAVDRLKGIVHAERVRQKHQTSFSWFFSLFSKSSYQYAIRCISQISPKDRESILTVINLCLSNQTKAESFAKRWNIDLQKERQDLENCKKAFEGEEVGSLNFPFLFHVLVKAALISGRKDSDRLSLPSPVEIPQEVLIEYWIDELNLACMNIEARKDVEGVGKDMQNFLEAWKKLFTIQGPGLSDEQLVASTF